VGGRRERSERLVERFGGGRGSEESGGLERSRH